ncbi:ParB/RepB/Spo0J family partition protein [Roseofilum sp. BLCC_M154]|uniref:ParB/RepB/Spo0J family partition protein n=1 Tax=Roseofilum acuticapitatum BLCC-M154 TaxID=3022444 RepID=A0ABT7APU0_9CYAN|nr:ParB/RepB/Spo0J family partition protein [Roseofilum acuticapitatum]MDJ1168912.1 ParB/RepB/Spo0J family partition protein [Roseofilum acuticapitatum BLCC-M154]
MSKSRRSLLEFTFRADTEPGALIPLELIRLPEQQPRRYFDPQKQDLLTESIKQHGILEPLLVRPHPEDKGKYELVAGERRYRSAKAAGLGEVPVVVRQLNDQEALQVAIVENLQREDLNPIEEVEGILQILAIELKVEVGAVSPLLYRLRHSVTSSGHNVMAKPESSSSGHNVMAKQLSQVEKVFQGLGMSWKSFTTNRLPLLNLPEELLLALRSGKIAYTGALAIARIKDEPLRKALLSEAITEKLSLQEIKKQVKTINSTPPEESKQQDLKKRLDKAFRRAQKVKAWDNPQKWQQIEEALDRLESLLE